jgi:AcrR family transcriptional regulator
VPDVQLPRSTEADHPPDDRAAVARARILAGLATALAQKGYAATTIADIAAAARVSRTTVYEHFAEKDGALVALYTDLGDRLLALGLEEFLRQGDDLPIPVRVERLVGAYLDGMADASEGERLSLLEIASAGPRGRAARRHVLDRFSRGVQRMSEWVLRDGRPGLQPLEEATTVGIVGGINELVLRAAEDGPQAVRDLRPTIAALIVHLMTEIPAPRD